ncbi:RsmB/NOP family class I SAM-dependent RNA methyltransferase [Micrococcoides hystricis]|uniref:RsmB/NOP family class I SAM-dependent RNA methyltransferase n=1 Tax=Micrococcoides hystricis TaxID=1572761 RepID=A0ABV6P705_9MICC
MSEHSGRGRRDAHRGKGRSIQGGRRNAAGRERNRGGSGPRKFSAQAPGQRSRSADPARLCAYEVLQAVAIDDAYANLLLPNKIREHRLDRQDAAFATELCYGALRLSGTYDAILEKCVDRPIKRLDPQVLDVLRLGSHQLLNMRVPAHAALNESVALTRDRIGAGAGGLVNAVLRRVSEKSIDEWVDELVSQAANEQEALQIRFSHPVWIIRALRQALKLTGRPESELEDTLAANNHPADLNFVALPGLGSLEPLVEKGAEHNAIAPDAVDFRGGDVARLPGVKEGTIRVQDTGSQLIARAVAALPITTNAESDKAWLDLCAGPGGKAALLAALAEQHDAHLLANEPAEHRAKLVRQALEPIPKHAWDVRVGDGRTIDSDAPAAGFGRILVDAPCTGLGALRRRPEARWRKQLSDVAELTPLQAELLNAAYRVLAPGGVLAYVTCSPHPVETVLQVQDFLRDHPEAELGDAKAALNAVAKIELFDEHDRAVTDPVVAKTAQLWPHRHDSDAMFMALIHKPQ